jgi:hypothetical protein
MRPVIYYLEHLVRDIDETKTFSRALISFVKYNNPKTIMHPMLVFVLEILWTHLASWQGQVTQQHVGARDSHKTWKKHGQKHHFQFCLR